MFTGGTLDAICGVPGHRGFGHVCRISRTVAPSDANARRGAGRPLGFLVSWLAASTDADLQGIDLHYSVGHNKSQAGLRFTHDERVASRAWLASLDIGAAVFLKERALLPGEPDEPLILV